MKPYKGNYAPSFLANENEKPYLHTMKQDAYESLLSLCEKRRSCRKFSPEDSLSETEVQQILDLAAHSPFASGRKNWKIAVITQKDIIESLAEAVQQEAEALSEEMEEESARFFLNYARSFTFFEDAPALFIPYCRESATMKSLLRDNASPEILQWDRDNLTKSLSCVAMLILLAAESLNLGACYMTGPLLAGKTLNRVLQLPENALLGAIVPVGHRL